MRCINIDWLEVYALEPVEVARDADYFRRYGFVVIERSYGTRVFGQMFTLADKDGHDLLEVRRAPLASTTVGGFLPSNCCHLRLVNRQCYKYGCVDMLRSFCAAYQYTVSRITRIDICLDFVKFDSGIMPNKFLQRYLKGKYTKINQSEISSHGRDFWTGRVWNSISWGRPRSAIGTKLYNKTQELREGRDKPYIKQHWAECGLIDNPVDGAKIVDGKLTYPDVWRLEFSIKSKVKRWVPIEVDGNERRLQSFPNTFEMYDTPEKLLAMFVTLTQHYFHFKVYEEGRSKYECKDRVLFNFGGQEAFCKVEHPASARPRDYDNTILLHRLRQYRAIQCDQDQRNACDVLIRALERKDMMRYCEDPTNRNQLIALQQTLAVRLSGVEVDPASLIAYFIEQLDKGTMF